MTGKGIVGENSGSGVTPLFCASCGQAVGIVNVDEAMRMIQTGEAYICNRCMALPEAAVVEELSGIHADYDWTLAMLGGLQAAV